MSTVFITGTDTGVGKTLVSCGLVRYWVKKNIKTTGFKPVASGASWLDGELKNEDALALHAVSNTALPYASINPYVFAEATAPHIAAGLAGASIDVAVIDQAYSDIAACSERVVIEGAGGWQVPLNPQVSFADWVAAHEWPVILVVNVKLGCINHARLSCLDILHCGNSLLGWVANVMSADVAYSQDMINSLQSYIDAPLFGILPPLNSPHAADISTFIDFSSLS